MPAPAPTLRGAFTALVTPFTDHGALDERRLVEQVTHQLENGIHGVVPVGTTGESPTLSFDEHFRVIELTVRTVAGRVPVVGGVGANATDEALRLHKFAKEVGCAAGLSVNPYYNKPTQEGLYRHFMTLAEQSGLPTVLYNVPGRCGVALAPATIARLRNATPELFVALKEAGGSVEAASAVMHECDIPVLCGDDALTVPMMSVGAVGVVSVLSNVLPAAVARLVELAENGDYASAGRLHRRLFPLVKPLFADGNPAGAKAALELQGRDSGVLRLPLASAGDAVRAMLKSELAKFENAA